MFVPGLAKTLSLWIAVVVLGHHAYHSASRAAAVDLRRPDGLVWIGLATLLGVALARWLARRRPTRWAPLDGDRWALTLLMAALAMEGLAHVEGYTSVRVIREQIPPAFAPLFPLWAAAIPLWLAATGRRLDAADQGLRLLTLVLAAGTALFLLDGASVLTLAVPIIFLQFRDGLPRARGLLALPLLAAALLLLATLRAHTPLLAGPTLAWVLASLCLLLGVAARPRDADDLRGLVAAALAAPLLVAVADVVLTLELAQEVSWFAALRTRPTLFRQHPNFLAPLFAVGCLLAASLAWSSRRGRVPALLAAALLAAATWHTDSNAGKGALLLGLVLLPGLRLALPFARRLPMKRLVFAGVALAVLLVAAVWVLRDSPALTPLTQRLDRFEKSLDYRLDAWRNSLRIIEESPWLGLGPGTFVSVERFAPESRFFNEPTSPHPHNVFLYIAQAGGLGCLLVVLAWLLGLGTLLGRAAAEPERSRLGRPLALGLLATLLALLGANLLDLGLALETVVPGPVFLITGLALAARVRREDPADDERPRFARAVVGCALLLAPWWAFGVRPVRADALFERAQHRGFLAARAEDGDALKAAALDDLRRATQLDPDHFAAHDLLARWTEQLPSGHGPAHDVLQRLVARAPHYGPAHSLLAQFFLRLGDDVHAAEALRRVVDDRHGSANLRRDRARLIETLARLGQRDQTFELLVDYLQLEAAIVHEIRWRGTPGSDDLVLPVERGKQRPIRLVDAVATLYDRQKRAELAGQPVGRRFWMDTPNAFRFAGRPDLALDVYAWLEAHADRVDFVQHNLHVLAGERGHVADEAGDLPAALAHFERAAELSAGQHSQPFYVTLAEDVRRRMAGDDDDDDAQAETTRLSEADAAAAFEKTGEILDQPTALRDNLDSRAEALLREGDPARAAALLEKSLLYRDELTERLELLERSATHYLEGGAAHDAERLFLHTLRELDAKPLPLSALVDGLADTQAARIARGLCAAWRAQGVPPRELLDAAWARVRRYTSSRTAMSLVRMEIARESGRVDQLEREAALALLEDAENTPALWARLGAFEALGRRDQLHAAMAPLAAQFADGGDPEARVANLVQSLMPREAEARTWREIGIARLLQGRYREAAGLFRSAQDRVPEGDTRGLGELLGWEARALLLSGQVDGARRRLHEAKRVDPTRPLLELILDTLGPAGGAAEGDA